MNLGWFSFVTSCSYKLRVTRLQSDLQLRTKIDWTLYRGRPVTGASHRPAQPADSGEASAVAQCRRAVKQNYRDINSSVWQVGHRKNELANTGSFRLRINIMFYFVSSLYVRTFVLWLFAGYYITCSISNGSPFHLNVTLRDGVGRRTPLNCLTSHYLAICTLKGARTQQL